MNTKMKQKKTTKKFIQNDEKNKEKFENVGLNKQKR